MRRLAADSGADEGDHQRTMVRIQYLLKNSIRAAESFTDAISAVRPAQSAGRSTDAMVLVGMHAMGGLPAQLPAFSVESQQEIVSR